MKVKLLLGALVAVALGGCATMNQELSTSQIHYWEYKPPTRTEAKIRVIWVTGDDVVELCLGGNRVTGCTFYDFASDISTLYITQPKDFNDTVALMRLGHEVYHAFGARHSANYGEK